MVAKCQQSTIYEILFSKKLYPYILPSENNLDFLYESINATRVLNKDIYKAIFCCLQFKYLILNQLLHKHTTNVYALRIST